MGALSPVLSIIVQKTAAHVRTHFHGIDFIERQPILDLALVVFEDGPGIVFKNIDHPAIMPTTETNHQIQRRFIV